MRDRNNHRWHCRIGAVLCWLVGMGIGLGEVYAKPPPWAPAYGWRAKHRHAKAKYIYHYYPAQQVYFLPAHRQYFWLDGGVWKVGMQLPPNVVVTGRPAIVDLDTELPYTRHPEIVVRFPLPVR